MSKYKSWTIQVIPNGKGSVRVIKLSSLFIVCSLLVILITAFGLLVSSIYFGIQVSAQDEKIAYLETYEVENEELKQYIEELDEKVVLLNEKITLYSQYISNHELEVIQTVPTIPPAYGTVSVTDIDVKDKQGTYGVNIVDSIGSAIYSTAKGTVMHIENKGGHQSIKIDHGNGYKTSYSHLSAGYVSEGDIVDKGEFIGRMGEDLDTTRFSVNYKIYKNGNAVNPTDYMEGGGSNVFVLAQEKGDKQSN